MGLYKRKTINKRGEEVYYWQIRIQKNGIRKTVSLGRVDTFDEKIAEKVFKTAKSQLSKNENLKYLEDLLHEFKNKYENKMMIIPMLYEFCDEYFDYAKNVEKQKSWRATKVELDVLKKNIGNKRLDEISSQDVIHIKRESIKNGLSERSVDLYLSRLRRLFNVAKQMNKFDGIIPVSSKDLFKVDNKKERILSYEEQDKLLDLKNCPPHLYSILVLAINTGMRKGELTSLKWENVDFNKKVITITASNSKSKRMRKIPMNDIVFTLLSNENFVTGFQEFVFINTRGIPYASSHGINKSFETACRRAGIKGLRFHDLRHTFATRSIENGANIVALSKILGHHSLQMTMRYAHPEKSLLEAVEGVETL